jgi:hypothetical protein
MVTVRSSRVGTLKALASRRLQALTSTIGHALSALREHRARLTALATSEEGLLARIAVATGATVVRLISRYPEQFARLVMHGERIAPDHVLRAQSRFPSLPWPGLEAPSPEQVILDDLDALSPQQKDAVAENLALLWNCFAEEFGGVSGFLAEPATQQAAYLAKLDTAAKRMEPAKATEVGHHYVSVALMMHYVSSFQGRSTDQSAIAMSNRVAELIDRGRHLKATKESTEKAPQGRKPMTTAQEHASQEDWASSLQPAETVALP